MLSIGWRSKQFGTTRERVRRLARMPLRTLQPATRTHAPIHDVSDVRQQTLPQRHQPRPNVYRLQLTRTNRVVMARRDAMTHFQRLAQGVGVGMVILAFFDAFTQDWWLAAIGVTFILTAAPD